MEGIEDRIIKDIDIFYKNVKIEAELTDREREVVELAEMYAKDSRSWLEKGDFYTAFSSISYAHGLLDAVRKIKGVYDVG